MEITFARNLFVATFAFLSVESFPSNVSGENKFLQRGMESFSEDNSQQCGKIIVRLAARFVTR